MDLWKNFLGSLDRQKLELADFEKQKTNIQADLQMKNFQVEVRKLYWSIIANNESIKIADKLLSSSELQLEDAEKRKKASIANETEVARLRAQVASRKALVSSLNYQKEAYNRALRSMVPSIKSKDITFTSVDVDKTVKQVKTCALSISQQKEDSLKDTLYFDLINTIEKKQLAQKEITDKTDSMDIKLLGNYQFIANELDSQYESTYDTLTDAPFNAHSVGVQISIPIGSGVRKLERTKNLVEKYNYESEKSELLSELNAQRKAILPYVALMFEGLRN